MNEINRAIMRGLLYNLERHRLSAHSEQTLTTSTRLVDDLLALNVLPDVLADRLKVFRGDVAAAALAKRTA